MLRTERYKYCVYVDGEDRESLVDLQADPGELQNLASLSEYRETLNQHRGYLQEWIEESDDQEAKDFAIGAKPEG